MGTINAVEYHIMGQAVTFDVVTFYGLICATIFASGLAIASLRESRRSRRVYGK